LLCPMPVIRLGEMINVIDTGDTKESLTAANAASVIMTTIRAGIGLHAGSIRGIGAAVANGVTRHSGITPILKWYESAVKAFSQGNRGGSATVYMPWWSYEIEKILFKDCLFEQKDISTIVVLITCCVVETLD